MKYDQCSTVTTRVSAVVEPKARINRRAWLRRFESAASSRPIAAATDSRHEPRIERRDAWRDLDRRRYEQSCQADPEALCCREQ